MKSTHNETVRLKKLANTLNQALAKLDERGTDSTVSKAMSIVFVGFETALNGKEIAPDALYRIAVQRDQRC